MNKLIGGIKFLGIKNIIRTLKFNFKYFPIKTAIKLPVVVYQKIETRSIKKGKIVIEQPGFQRLSLGGAGTSKYTYSKPIFLSIAKFGKMVIKGDGFHVIQPGANISVKKNAVLEIGNNFSVGYNLQLYVSNYVSIGNNNNMWSYDLIVLDSDAHKIMDSGGNLISKLGTVNFGDDVWVCSRCTILKNTSIPDGCIIGSNTVVSHKLEERNSIYAGKDVRLVKRDIRWSRDYIN